MPIMRRVLQAMLHATAQSVAGRSWPREGNPEGKHRLHDHSTHRCMRPSSISAAMRCKGLTEQKRSCAVIQSASSTISRFL